jgi:hypothetical protein
MTVSIVNAKATLAKAALAKAGLIRQRSRILSSIVKA